MLTVGNDAARLERMLEEGSLGCPGCGGRLARWDHARKRTVFGPVRAGGEVRPRRSRCTVCRVTHVLLPARLLLRRMDEAPVIGAALAAAGRGLGCRRVAAELEVPVDTVRGWLRRAAGRAGLRLTPGTSPTCPAPDHHPRRNRYPALRPGQAACRTSPDQAGRLQT